MLSTLLTLLLAMPPATQPTQPQIAPGVVQTDPAMVAQAQTLLAAAEAKAAQLRGIQVTAPQEALEASLRAKVEGYGALQHDYAKVIILNDPNTTVAAIMGMAATHRDYAQALRSVPMPEALKGEARAARLAALEAQAAGLDAEARRIYEKALAFCEKYEATAAQRPAIEAALKALAPSKQP